MGGEFAQDREWNHDSSLEHLLANPFNSGVRTLIRDLNRVYRALPALHELDCEAAGFEWLVANDRDNSVVAFSRRGKQDGSMAVVVCNFTPVPRQSYRFGVALPGFYREAVNTDAEAYGGSNVGNLGGVEAAKSESHGKSWSLSLTLPPLATLILERVGPSPPTRSGQVAYTGRAQSPSGRFVCGAVEALQPTAAVAAVR